MPGENLNAAKLAQLMLDINDYGMALEVSVD